MKQKFSRYGIFIVLPILAGLITTVSVCIKTPQRINAILLTKSTKAVEIYISSAYKHIKRADNITIEFDNKETEKVVIDSVITEPKHIRCVIRIISPTPRYTNTIENVNIIRDEESLYNIITKKILQ